MGIRRTGPAWMPDRGWIWNARREAVRDAPYGLRCPLWGGLTVPRLAGWLILGRDSPQKLVPGRRPGAGIRDKRSGRSLTSREVRLGWARRVIHLVRRGPLWRRELVRVVRVCGGVARGSSLREQWSRLGGGARSSLACSCWVRACWHCLSCAGVARRVWGGGSSGCGAARLRLWSRSAAGQDLSGGGRALPLTRAAGLQHPHSS